MPAAPVGPSCAEPPYDKSEPGRGYVVVIYGLYIGSICPEAASGLWASNYTSSDERNRLWPAPRGGVATPDLLSALDRPGLSPGPVVVKDA